MAAHSVVRRPQLTVQNPGGNFSATVTVTDGRAGSPTGTVDFIAGSMSGNCVSTTGSLLNMTLLLNQSSSGIVTGTWNRQESAQETSIRSSLDKSMLLDSSPCA